VVASVVASRNGILMDRWRLKVLAWSVAGSVGAVGAIVLLGWLVQGYVIGHGCSR